MLYKGRTINTHKKEKIFCKSSITSHTSFQLQIGDLLVRDARMKHRFLHSQSYKSKMKHLTLPDIPMGCLGNKSKMKHRFIHFLLTSPSNTTKGGVMMSQCQMSRQSTAMSSLCEMSCQNLSSHYLYDYPQKKDYNNHSGILLSSHKKIHSIIFTDKDRSKKRSFVTTPYITNTTNATKGGVSSDRNTFKPTHTSHTYLTKGQDTVTDVTSQSDVSSPICKPKVMLEESVKSDVMRSVTSNTPRGSVKSDVESSICNKRSVRSDVSSLTSHNPFPSLTNRRRDVRNVREYFIKHTKRKKIKGVLGKIYISTTKNNTIITLIDSKGNTKGWSCSGSLGFKNARKSTTYAAQAAAENIVKKAKILGYTHLRLLVKGLGRGKQSCLRALSKSGLKIISIEDKTGIPYNGCRLSKKRRV